MIMTGTHKLSLLSRAKRNVVRGIGELYGLIE